MQRKASASWRGGIKEAAARDEGSKEIARRAYEVPRNGVGSENRYTREAAALGAE